MNSSAETKIYRFWDSGPDTNNEPGHVLILPCYTNEETNWTCRRTSRGHCQQSVSALSEQSSSV